MLNTFLMFSLATACQAWLLLFYSLALKYKVKNKKCEAESCVRTLK
jgi:hypothetical protein